VTTQQQEEEGQYTLTPHRKATTVPNFLQQQKIEGCNKEDSNIKNQEGRSKEIPIENLEDHNKETPTENQEGRSKERIFSL
jgi:hypothetical protein